MWSSCSVAENRNHACRSEFWKSFSINCSHVRMCPGRRKSPSRYKSKKCACSFNYFFLVFHLQYLHLISSNNDPTTLSDQSTMSPAVPLATTSSENNTPFGRMQVKGSRSTFTHSPVVMAMITNNRLTNCRDVSAMMQECQASGSGDQLCRTASNYFDMCMESSGSK